MSYASVGPGSLSSARVVLPIVFDLLEPRRVADIGCGTGMWLAVCRELGAQRIILRVDGKWVTSRTLQIPVESFQSADLCDEDVLANNPAVREARARKNLGQLSMIQRQLFAMHTGRSKFQQWAEPYTRKLRPLFDQLRGRQ